MDRTILETVQLLGLDVELAIVAVLVALEWLRRLAEGLRSTRAERRPASRLRRPLPAALAARSLSIEPPVPRRG